VALDNPDRSDKKSALSRDIYLSGDTPGVLTPRRLIGSAEIGAGTAIVPKTDRDNAILSHARRWIILLERRAKDTSVK